LTSGALSDSRDLRRVGCRAQQRRPDAMPAQQTAAFDYYEPIDPGAPGP
jgi:hypothetical protein